MGIILVLLTAVTIVGIAFVEKNVIHKTVGTTLSESANNEAAKIARDVSWVVWLRSCQHPPARRRYEMRGRALDGTRLD